MADPGFNWKMAAKIVFRIHSATIQFLPGRYIIMQQVADFFLETP